MEYKVPTMSTDGALFDNDLKVSRLFTYFLIAEHSQSYFYTNKVKSLKYIASKFNDDKELVSLIKDALKELYDRYFKDTEVEVKLERIREDSPAIMLHINVNTYTVDKNKKLTLARSIELENRILKYKDEFIEQLNRGNR